MNEFIRVHFRRNGKRIRVARQLPGGIEFAEPDPIERSVGIAFNGATEATRERMNSIRRIQGWDPGQFKLRMAVEDGALMLRGVGEHALPEGVYKLLVEIEEAKLAGGARRVGVEHDGHGVVDIDLAMDDRVADVDLDECDAAILAVLDRSEIDGMNGAGWVIDPGRRSTRRACLLNLLASLRTRPSLGSPLVGLVQHVFFVGNDRIYAKVDRVLVGTMEALAADPVKPFYAEGRPRAAIHGRLLTSIPEETDVKARFVDLLSFRGEGKPSMQVVIATPPPELPHTYAEFDLDLGNPLQDVLGFFVHMGELLDGKPTNHLDLRKDLGKTKAGRFLPYTVSAA
jgi:hypothetical protein